MLKKDDVGIIILMLIWDFGKQIINPPLPLLSKTDKTFILKLKRDRNTINEKEHLE